MKEAGGLSSGPPSAHQAGLALGAHGERGKGDAIWPWSFYPTQACMAWDQMDLRLCVIWNLRSFAVCKEFSFLLCYFPWADHASVIEWQPLPGSLTNLKSVRDSGAKGHQKEKGKKLKRCVLPILPKRVSYDLMYFLKWATFPNEPLNCKK